MKQPKFRDQVQALAEDRLLPLSITDKYRNDLLTGIETLLIQLKFKKKKGKGRTERDRGTIHD